MKLDITATPRAEEMIAELAEWWDENRRDATELRVTLESVCDRLAENPFLGRPHPHARIEGIRKYRLLGTPYLLYYLPLVEPNELRVIGVWSGMRKRGPFLEAE